MLVKNVRKFKRHDRHQTVTLKADMTNQHADNEKHMQMILYCDVKRVSLRGVNCNSYI